MKEFTPLSASASKRARRVEERGRLLARALQALEADPRVCAAWLFGSLGRGAADALSDLDLFVVVEDAAIEAVVAERGAFMARLGPPLLTLEAPQNRPPHGAYNMALYEGAEGPHQVDWYWQPRFAAAIPAQTRVLLDRVGLPHLDSPPHFDYQPVPEQEATEATLREDIRQKIHFFWVMLLIAAKYAARKPEEERMGLLGYVQTPLEEVSRFAAAALPAPIEAPTPTLPAKLDRLRALAAQMEAVMPQAAARGVAAPADFPPHVYRYLDFIAEVSPHLPEQ